MRVTFDTNTLADIVSPDTSQRLDGSVHASKVRAAIQAGNVQGVFCETLITLEGIKNADRSAVFGSTLSNATYHQETALDGNRLTRITMRPEQVARKPLDHKQAARFLVAFDLGMKLLGAPRIGMIRVDDPKGERYLAEPGESVLSRRLERYFEVATAIEHRGVGCAEAMQIAHEIQAELGGSKSFVAYLGSPRDPVEQKRINRAIAEWADGDSIAAHYGYAIGLFCSEDFGKSRSQPSILDDKNRAWLTDTFGIQFVTMAQLAGMLTT
jgi:hypothetical protein